MLTDLAVGRGESMTGGEIANEIEDFFLSRGQVVGHFVILGRKQSVSQRRLTLSPGVHYRGKFGSIVSQTTENNRRVEEKGTRADRTRASEQT